jgi:hypothetical protein
MGRTSGLDEVCTAIHAAHPVLPEATVSRLVQRLASKYSFLAGTLMLAPVVRRDAAQLLDYVFADDESSMLCPPAGHRVVDHDLKIDLH